MPKFLSSDIADLTHQLTLSPRRLRVEQIRGIERLIGMIEPDQAYPLELVCYQITGFHKRGPTTGPLVPSSALLVDLVTMAEQISRKANLTLAELGEPYRTHQQVADQLNVSTKTVRRWRARGLMGVRAVCEDGVNRLAFLQRGVDRFVRKNKDLVAKGASFKLLSDAERRSIVTRAHDILSQKRMKLHACAKVIAEETGRAVETVRYTLRRNDNLHPDAALFSNAAEHAYTEQELAIVRCHKAGESLESIGRAYGCSAVEVEQTLCDVQTRQWAERPPECVYNELFDAPDADALILDLEEPVATDGRRAPRIPKDLPSYLQSLYLTPLLTFEQEQDLFRRYNYVKFKAAKLVTEMGNEPASPERFLALRSMMNTIDQFKQRIVQANLRLVVSIAKKHVGWSANFFEVISDGNVSLMRAVEKFDFSRGNKFSTYASWAIIKNYARSIPEEHYRCARYVTGQDGWLDAAPDVQPERPFESDRSRVRELIASGLETLTDREREIVSGHFGLSGQGGKLTLEQLGNRFGVTKERVRQIEQRAISRLRDVLSPSLVDTLAD